MASLTVTVRFVRKGLEIEMYVGETHIGGINLQRYLGLSDEEAKELLAKLDEKEAQ